MKNKGFTLVELLAVIVILAIISLIATPMILGVIEKSKKSAAIESINGIIDAAEKYMIEGMITGENITKFDLSTDTKLSYKGKKPESGTLLINEKGKMSIKAKINGYCVLKKYNESAPQVVDNSICEGNYKEEILNGTDPVLKDKLVPVTIADNGTVTYADTRMEWYDYEDKVWANAVILVDSPSKTYSVGDTILEDDIESYFVWISKYSYKLWDLGNYSNSQSELDTNKVHSIDIVFGTTNTNDTKVGECTTPLTSGDSGNCVVRDYMTHPAFITMNTTGLWVGKFETGYKGATSTSAAQVNSNDESKIIIKPNVYSWRNITVGNIFTAAYNYERNLDSHMMKNTEWGAVAYLSHSKYGINEEVMINNQDITGYSSKKCPSCVWQGESKECNAYGASSISMKYNTQIGYKSSTTGNITGIYDTSGGLSEYVSGYMEGYLGNSELTVQFVDSNSKYFDKYKNNSTTGSHDNRILGDATGEMGPFSMDYEVRPTHVSSWYYDNALFVASDLSWFNRGDSFSSGTLAGIFASNAYNGTAASWCGFRLVLAP